MLATDESLAESRPVREQMLSVLPPTTQARARELGVRLYLWHPEGSVVTRAISNPKEAKATRIRRESAAEQLFHQQPTRLMGNIPSIGYYFEGCEYVFVDSHAKARYIKLLDCAARSTMPFL